MLNNQKPLYEIQYLDEEKTIPCSILKTDEGLWIPLDEKNTEYLKYQQWLASQSR